MNNEGNKMKYSTYHINASGLNGWIIINGKKATEKNIVPNTFNANKEEAEQECLEMNLQYHYDNAQKCFDKLIELNPEKYQELSLGTLCC